VTGVTGTKTPVAASVTPDLLRIRQRTDLPVAVGFGISTPAQVRSFAADADGVVIGSALVKWLAEHGGSPDLMSRLTVYVRGLKAATG
ncbi:MAG TPA: tryptophan synthase subunit alpha, partial [Syntrophales bacterium]|nr:tryptophan synthase subunit alpha [Syntrophales bacterium]